MMTPGALAGWIFGAGQRRWWALVLAVLVATLRLVFTPVLERLPGRRLPARSLRG